MQIRIKDKVLSTEAFVSMYKESTGRLIKIDNGHVIFPETEIACPLENFVRIFNLIHTELRLEIE